MAFPRSFLYVPGDRPDRIEGAPGRGADALILDLEDAVAPANKDTARATVASMVGSLDAEVWVRVNAGARMSGDVAAVVLPGLTGIIVAKCESPDTLAALDDIIATAEERAGVAHVKIAPLVESARGVQQVDEIARGPRVSHLAIGEADLTADLGIVGADHALDPIRMRVVVASAAAGLAAPTGSVSTDFRDLEPLRTSTERLRDMGFGARPAIHPAQIEVINEVFTPTPDEVARAQDLLDRMDAADGGVTVDADGKMIDEALARSARAVIARAR